MVDPGEPPYLRQLRAIALGDAPKLSADAIKQHYVPSFLIARWATPQNRNGTLTQLNVTSGAIASRKAGKVATEPELYTIDADTPSPDRSIEGLLGLFETNAADPIKNLASIPTTISDDDRLTIAMFLAFQQGRTPAGLAQHLRVVQMAVEASLHKFFGDRQKVAAYVRAHIDPNAEDEDVKTWATSEIKAFSPARGSSRCRRGAIPGHAQVRDPRRLHRGLARLDAAGERRRRVHHERSRAGDARPGLTLRAGVRVRPDESFGDQAQLRDAAVLARGSPKGSTYPPTPARTARALLSARRRQRGAQQLGEVVDLYDADRA